MTRLDRSGRERRFITGHNSRRGVRTGARPKSETGAGISANQKEALLESFGGLCAYGCGRQAQCWDHVIPWSEGGSFRQAGNAVPACRPCNQEKGAGDLTAVWHWIDKGMQSDQAEAWLSITDLAISWGVLEYPEEVAA